MDSDTWISESLAGAGLPAGTTSPPPVHQSLHLTSNHFPSHLLLRSSLGQVNEATSGLLPRDSAPPAWAPLPSSRTGAEHRWAVITDRLRADLQGYLFAFPGRRLHQAWLAEGRRGHWSWCVAGSPSQRRTKCHRPPGWRGWFSLLGTGSCQQVGEGPKGGEKERKYNVSIQQQAVCVFQEPTGFFFFWEAKLISIKNSSVLNIYIWGGLQFSLVDSLTLPSQLRQPSATRKDTGRKMKIILLV